MRKAKYVPAIAVVGGVIGLILRLLYLHYGTEPDTGLPVLGSIHGLIMWIWCVVIAAVLLYVTGGKHERFPKRYTAAFKPQNQIGKVLYLGGCFLLALSGFTNIMGFSIATVDAMGQRSVGVARPILGVLCFFAASAIYFISKAMGEGREANKYLISFPGIAACFWVVANYQDWARDPFMDRYMLHVFAVVLTMLAITMAAGFGFGDGKVSGTLFFTAETSAFCIMLLGDGLPLYELSTLLGMTFFMLAQCFSLAANDGIPQPPPDPEEDDTDGEKKEANSACASCPAAAADGGCTTCPSAQPEESPTTDNNDTP